jgi:hypothetical protein
MLADGEDNVLIGVAESVVRGQVGSDLVGMYPRRFRHKKALLIV